MWESIKKFFVGLGSGAWLIGVAIISIIIAILESIHIKKSGKENEITHDTHQTDVGELLINPIINDEIPALDAKIADDKKKSEDAEKKSADDFKKMQDDVAAAGPKPGDTLKHNVDEDAKLWN